MYIYIMYIYIYIHIYLPRAKSFKQGLQQREFRYQLLQSRGPSHVGADPGVAAYMHICIIFMRDNIRTRTAKCDLGNYSVYICILVSYRDTYTHMYVDMYLYCADIHMFGCLLDMTEASFAL